MTSPTQEDLNAQDTGSSEFNVEAFSKTIPETINKETYAKSPEWLRSLYTSTDNGYAYNPVIKLKKALNDEKNNVATRSKELSEKLLMIEQAKQLLGLPSDKDLTEGISGLKQELEIYKTSKGQSEQELSAKIQEYSNKHENERARLQIEHQKNLNALKEDYSKKEADLIKSLKSAKIGYDLKEAGADHNVLKYAYDKLLTMTKLNQDGDLIVLDENGDPRLGSKGREMLFAEYVNEDLRKDMPFAFPMASIKESAPNIGSAKQQTPLRQSNGRPSSAAMFGLDGQIQHTEKGAFYFPKAYDLDPANLHRVKQICKENGLILSYNPIS